MRIDQIAAIGRRAAWLGAVLVAATAWGASSALAVTQRSNSVAVIRGEGTPSAGALQTSGTVAGSPDDSFDQFSFTDLSQEATDPTTLSHYDTVVLNQVLTSSLSEAQRQALSSFVTSGGKLIIHDADGTEGNNYSWLPVPAASGLVGSLRASGRVSLPVSKP